MIARRYFQWKIILVGCLALFFHPIANAALAPAVTPKISLIIDNLGDQKHIGLEVAHLPGAIACSILPQQKFSVLIATECHQQQKIVILNTPMQALKPFKLGQGGLYQGMGESKFLATLQKDIEAVPYISGLDNHMGSLLTTLPREMRWLMQAIKPRGLFLLDNRTSPHSVALRIAQENKVPAIGRDIFLDDVRTPQAVRKQFDEALKIAKRYGSVVVVAHPNPITLKFLAETLPRLKNYQWVPITDLLPEKIQGVSVTPIPSKQLEKPLSQSVSPSIASLPTKITQPSFWQKIKIKAKAIFSSSASAPKAEKPHRISSSISELIAKLRAQAAKYQLEKKLLANSSAAKANDTSKLVIESKPEKSKTSFFAGLHERLCRYYSQTCTQITKPQVAIMTSLPFAALQGKLPWPTQGSILIRYGEKTERNSLRYTGVLIKAPLGQPVYAIYPGRVVFANWLQGFGLLLIIDHGDGYMTLYGHNQILYKKVGDAVQTQDKIATVGNSGSSQSPTGLYFEIRYNSEPVNPQVWCVSKSK